MVLVYRARDGGFEDVFAGMQVPEFERTITLDRGAQFYMVHRLTGSLIAKKLDRPRLCSSDDRWPAYHLPANSVCRRLDACIADLREQRTCH
jgi:hypothetical protein